MIGNYGGLQIDADGNRSYPGSAGYVGSLQPTETWGGYAAALGAGSTYHSFTPPPNEMLAQPGDVQPSCPIEPGSGSRCTDPPDDPPTIDTGGGGGGGGTGGGGGGTGGGGTGGGPVDCTGRGCPGGAGDGGGIDPTNPIWQAITNLLTTTPKTPINTQGPLYFFNPEQPGAAIVQGIKPVWVVVAAVVGLLGYLAYKHFQ